jgi:hypothetical protein
MGNCFRKKKEKDVIVSLTSHPKRINTVYKAIESILNGSVLPYKIVLNLAENDFKDTEQINVVNNILDKLFQKYNYLDKILEIDFTDDYKAGTKLIPTLIKYPSHKIITIDDDRIYNKNLVKILSEESRKFPEHIICPVARKYVFNNENYEDNNINNSYSEDKLIDYLKQDRYYDNSGIGIFEGFAGVLYPPKSLDIQVFNFEAFKNLCPYADDIWFQVMAIKKGTLIKGISKENTEDLFWPPEIENTQEVGLFKEHLLANSWMFYRTMHYYNLLHVVNLSFKNKLSCKLCKRNIKLYSEHKDLCPYGKNKCPECLNFDNKIVLCIGSYDYGNIGDGMYKFILSNYLKNDNTSISLKSYFVADTVRINSKGNYIPFYSSETDLDFDYLIIGGGGILKNFSDKSSYKYYLDLATNKNKPYFFVSVGIQTLEQNLDVTSCKSLLGNSIKYLNNSELVCVRSITDYSLLFSILENNYKLYTYPDLGYLINNFIDITSISKKYITLFQTGSANVKLKHIKDLIDSKLNEYKNSKLIIINLGGKNNPAIENDFDEYELFNEAKTIYPDAEIYFGDSISKELKDIYYKNKEIKSSDINLNKVIEIIASSYYVITGRYHGLIFSKALNIEVYPAVFNYKINAEINKSNLGLTNPLEQIELIIKLINNKQFIKNPNKWTDDDRNTYIVKLNDKIKLEISFIQSMDNITIYKKLLF